MILKTVVGKGARFIHLYILDRPIRRMSKYANLAPFKWIRGTVRRARFNFLDASVSSRD